MQHHNKVGGATETVERCWLMQIADADAEVIRLECFEISLAVNPFLASVRQNFQGQQLSREAAMVETRGVLLSTFFSPSADSTAPYPSWPEFLPNYMTITAMMMMMMIKQPQPHKCVRDTHSLIRRSILVQLVNGLLDPARPLKTS